MPLVPLIQGAYEARSIIASAQSCINLYPERNPQDSPVPFTHYLAPGLTATGTNLVNPPRWEYLASNGNMYSVVGNSMGSQLWVSTPSGLTQGIGTTTLIGNFTSYGSTPVSMADNGIVLIIVDGSPNGWVLDLTNSANFAQIVDPIFVGATKVDYIDTFFVFNKPGTFEWYISLSESTFQMFAGTSGAILTGTITEDGSGSFLTNMYPSVVLTGGSGTGATANITVVQNSVTDVTIITPGINYLVNDQLSAMLPGTGVLTGNITAGSGYTNGVYLNYLLTGGGGTGATANITVSAGVVSNVQIVTGGANYGVADILTAALPAGSSFVYTVTTIGGAGLVYTVDTVAGTAFDPLDFATKSGYPDPIVGLIVMDLYIWLLGTQTTEIWFNAGAADFPFQIFPGVFIEHGCAAQYSIAKQDLSIYWLSQDKQGQCIVMKGNNFTAHRISTYAIENEFSTYSIISDAIGWTYQQEGHVFYVLTFPTADKTWVWDESTQLWHQRASLQYVPGAPANIQPGAALTADGNLHKVLYHNTAALCGGLLYTLDDLGNQYQVNPSSYTENGFEIPKIRSFPHMVEEMDRVSYKRFIADMECGIDTATTGGDASPMIRLRWSDDRGKTYSNYVSQTFGTLGTYLTNIQWRRLGMARDRVFELSWSLSTETSLNGAWIETEKTGT